MGGPLVIRIVRPWSWRSESDKLKGLIIAEPWIGLIIAGQKTSPQAVSGDCFIRTCPS
jgi:hypothetical protein